jgi:hypothetical protein
MEWGHLIMSMGLSDISKAMSPVRASYQSRVQSQNAVTNEVVDKNEQRQNQTPQLMSSSFDVANNGLRSKGGRVDIKV